jgi:hypothetical protein
MSYTPPINPTYTSAIGVNSDTAISGGNWTSNTYLGVGEQNDYSYVAVNLQTDEVGTLTFEFSQDGTNWSEYPTVDFTVASGINEVHGAWKGTRYVRVKFIGTGGRSHFRLRTMYSYAPVTLSAPLNQPISADSDANIVRAVSIGETPGGSYNNVQADGLGFSTNSVLTSGQTYDSGILSLVGYTQVQTDLLSVGANGTTTIKFYEDAGGTNLLRTLVSPYTSGDGFKILSAPAFTPYVRYQFECTSTGQTQFYFDTKFTTKSISGQILGLNDFVSGGMVANLGRSVIVGQEPDGSFTNQKIDGVAFRTDIALVSGGTYTSTLVSTEGYSQIETHMFSNVAGALTGRWYNDSAKTILLRTFTRPYAGDEVGTVSYFSSPIFGPYIEYEYTNGSIGQTSFFLDFHPRIKSISGQILGMNDFIPAGVVANLGRNVIVGKNDAGGFNNVNTDTVSNLKVAIQSPTTAFGEVQVAEMTPVIQVTYPYNINTQLVNTTTENGATITQVDSMVSLATSTSSSSIGILNTINVAKYRAGQGVVARFTALFTSGATTSDSRQVIGIGDDNDGYFFGYSGDTYGIHHRINSGTTFISQSEWNVDTMDGGSDGSNPSGMLLDPTKGNVFQIQYQWLGFGAVNFFIESDYTGKYVPVHQIKYANNEVIPSSYNPTFPIRAEVNNGTSTDVLTMKSSSMAAFVEGKNVITGPLQSANGSNTGGNDGELLALRSVSVFPSGATTTNRVVAYLRDLSISNDGANNTIVRIQVIEDPVYSVSPTYTYKDANSSIIQVGVGGTYTTGSGKVLATFGVTQVSNVFTELTNRGIAIRPGRTIGFITQGDNSTSTEVDISWVEDF